MSKNFKTFIISMIGTFALCLVLNGISNNALTAQISEPLEQVRQEEAEVIKLPDPTELQIEANSAFSVFIDDKNKQTILYQKNTDEILPIASLTKLMTAIVVLENPETYPMDLFVPISQKAANQALVPLYGNLNYGEGYTVETLLSLALIYSSNDAAHALSEVIGTGEFVELMNQKALELGLDNTNFANPTGLDPDDLKWSKETYSEFNYSTANDLFLLCNYIIKNHLIIFETSTQDGPYDTLNGTSSLLLSDEKIFLGGKTGYTDEAGGCLIYLFKKDNNVFVNILLGAESSESRIVEMQKIINWINL